jgi:DNA-binding SARP family transcriptional activator/predicted ATPase
MMKLELRLFGGLQLGRDGALPIDFSSEKGKALLCYLAVTGQPHARAALAGLLWPESPEENARASLRRTLTGIRKIAPDCLNATRHTVAINSDVPIWVDVTHFETLVHSPTDINRLQEAAALYQGDFLEQIYLPDTPAFDSWVLGQRARLRQMALETLRTLANHFAEWQEFETAVTYVRQSLEIEPWREDGHRELMRVLALSGQRGAALKQYDICVQMLASELSVSPSAETTTLYEQIRDDELKAEDNRQQLPGLPPQPANNLPAAVTTFVGRETELVNLAPLIADPQVRLITITGPGGVGKTRLALEAAQREVGAQSQFSDGVFFVSLAPLESAGDIVAELATTLDFRFGAGASPREQLMTYLSKQKLLLVLDNFEHLLDGVELVSDLLQRAPGMQIIVTSRARLNLGAEFVFDVAGLGLPEADDGFEAAEAVAMFLVRARQVQPGFAVSGADRAAVARLCRLVAGMPLVLELAANWVRYLSPAGIVRELIQDLDFLESERADLPARQRSMRAAFEHSWRLLAEDQRLALMRLSVFRGGASRRAATMVTGTSLRTLVALVDHSLLYHHPESGRFAIHELIRQFARERLEAAGAVEVVRDAHSAYYLGTLADLLPDLKGRDQLGALDDIKLDFENVRAAWLRAVAQGQWQHIPEAGQSLFIFGFFQDRHLDTIEMLEAVYHAIPAAGTKQEQLAYAYALASRQALLSRVLPGEEQRFHLSALRTLAKTGDDPDARAYCQLMLGQVLLWAYNNREPEAKEVLERARRYYEQAQEPFYTAFAFSRLALAYNRLGNAYGHTALDLSHRGLAYAQEAGDRFVAAALWNNLGVITSALEGPSKAVENYYQECAKLIAGRGNREHSAIVLFNLANIPLFREGDLATSRALLDEAQAFADEHLPTYVGYPAGLAKHRLVEGRYEEVLVLTEEVLALVAVSAGHDPSKMKAQVDLERGTAFLALGNREQAVRFMGRGLAVMVEHNFENLARNYLPFIGLLLAQRGEHERAVAFIAHGVTCAHARGMLEVVPLLQRARADLAEILGEASFAAAWERGRQLDAMAAAREILQELEVAKRSG